MTLPSPFPAPHSLNGGVFSNHSSTITTVRFTPTPQQATTPDSPETAA